MPGPASAGSASKAHTIAGRHLMCRCPRTAVGPRNAQAAACRDCATRVGNFMQRSKTGDSVVQPIAAVAPELEADAPIGIGAEQVAVLDERGPGCCAAARGTRGTCRWRLLSRRERKDQIADALLAISAARSAIAEV